MVAGKRPKLVAQPAQLHCIYWTIHWR